MFNTIVSLLPKSLQPAAKAIIPAVLVLGGVVYEFAANGHLDPEATAAAVSGLVLAVVTFLVPNR